MIITGDLFRTWSFVFNVTDHQGGSTCLPMHLASHIKSYWTIKGLITFHFASRQRKIPELNAECGEKRRTGVSHFGGLASAGERAGRGGC